jgi:GNAT superfamily N-acetyltransferase
MMELLQRWLNYPPSPDAPFITDQRGEKFWVYWDESGHHANMHVSYRGRHVGRVNLVFKKTGEAIIADLIIFNAKLRGHGLGKAMLGEAISRAIANNTKFIWGWIEPDEYTTVEYLTKWYRKQGFDVVKENDKSFIEKSLE